MSFVEVPRGEATRDPAQDRAPGWRVCGTVEAVPLSRAFGSGDEAARCWGKVGDGGVGERFELLELNGFFGILRLRHSRLGCECLRSE